MVAYQLLTMFLSITQFVDIRYSLSGSGRKGWKETFGTGPPRTFFSWFGNNSDPNADDIAEVSEFLFD